MVYTGKNPYGGMNEIISHSSIKTNERLNDLFKRIEFFCELCWNEPKKENLLAYFSCLKSVYNEVYPVIKDNQFVEIVDIFPRLYITIRSIVDISEIKEADWSYSEQSQKLIKSRELISICLNNLDFIHQVLIASLQDLKYFFRIEAKPIKGAKARLEIIRKKGNMTGMLGVPGEEDEEG